MTVLDSETEMRRQPLGTSDLSEQYQDQEGEACPPPPSLFDDVIALFDDGKTYAQAEVAYQKSRAGFVASRIKFIVAYGAAAFGVFHLALIGLTVGIVIALIPLVGPWIATAIVTLSLVVLGMTLLNMLKKKVGDIRAAFAEDGQ
jgi:uncharacterized membrane protein YfbV (UPF0208 family)